MTNLTTDPDSRASSRAAMASLFCAGTMAKVRDTDKPDVMSVVLHEAAHNLGPSHDYKVNGKEDDAVFGGPLASTLEELKAQTAALYFPGWLVERKLITAIEADESRLRNVAWGFGHVSRGMYDADGKPKNYSQLASIQLAHLMKSSVLEWKPAEAAANGADKGCFEVHLDRWQPAVEALAKIVLGIKSRGDKPAAEKLVLAYVDAKDAWADLRKTITDRWLRSPRGNLRLLDQGVIHACSPAWLPAPPRGSSPYDPSVLASLRAAGGPLTPASPGVRVPYASSTPPAAARAPRDCSSRPASGRACGSAHALRRARDFTPG